MEPVKAKRPRTRRPRAGRRIEVDLGDMKGELLAFCRRQDVSVNDAMRQIVGRVLNMNVRDLPSLQADESIRHARIAVKVQLTACEHELVNQVARQMGFTMSRFFVAMVRALATRQPQLGEREVAALEESNYQLAAIGRNLNQIARALNADSHKVFEHDRLVIIDVLRKEINTHLTTVHAMQRANLDRWRQ